MEVKCPICNEGFLITPVGEVPDYLEPPVLECSECGDFISMAEKEES